MTPEESRRDESARWLAQARRDLNAARLLSSAENELGGQCAALNHSLAPLFQEASVLTDYAVVFCYLDAPHEPDESEAMAAIGTATRVLEEISALLALPGQS